MGNFNRVKVLVFLGLIYKFNLIIVKFLVGVFIEFDKLIRKFTCEGNCTRLVEIILKGKNNGKGDLFYYILKYFIYF